MPVNAWIKQQRKPELMELARLLGCEVFESMKKADVEATLESYILAREAALTDDSRVKGFWVSRARATGSPVRRMPSRVPESGRASRRHIVQSLDDGAPSPIASSSPTRAPGSIPDSEEDEPLVEVKREEVSFIDDRASTELEESVHEISYVKRSSGDNSIVEETSVTHISIPVPSQPSPNALIHSSSPLDSPLPTSGATLTPRRVNPIPELPATPADVAELVERSTLIVREQVSSMYRETGITERASAVQSTLSHVSSIIFSTVIFELLHLRGEVLPNRYAFTVPPIDAFGTDEYPVYVPDLFYLASSEFWVPMLLWALTSFVVPVTLGYLYNLPKTVRPNAARYSVDPLTFSIAKAIATYVIYAQGVTFGFVPKMAVARVNDALYGGWKGVLVGTAITGLMSFYEAVLSK